MRVPDALEHQQDVAACMPRTGTSEERKQAPFRDFNLFELI